MDTLTEAKIFGDFKKCSVFIIRETDEKKSEQVESGPLSELRVLVLCLN